jgi:excisionase family DNA binding protein
MSKPTSEKVLTLAEAAKFLRVSPSRVRGLAEAGKLPGRQLDKDWRFLKSALVEWLRHKPSSAEVFLRQAGSLKDDDTLPQLLEDIYKARGRPMVEPD